MVLLLLPIVSGRSLFWKFVIFCFWLCFVHFCSSICCLSWILLQFFGRFSLFFLMKTLGLDSGIVLATILALGRTSGRDKGASFSCWNFFIFAATGLTSLSFESCIRKGIRFSSSLSPSSPRKGGIWSPFIVFCIICLAESCLKINTLESFNVNYFSYINKDQILCGNLQNIKMLLEVVIESRFTVTSMINFSEIVRNS